MSTSTKYPPEFVRRVLTDISNGTYTGAAISEKTKVSTKTIAKWLNRGRIKRNVPATPEEIDAAVHACQTSGAKYYAEHDGTVSEVATTFRTLSEREQHYLDHGLEGLEAPADKMNTRELTAFASVLSCVDRQIDALEKSSQNSESVAEVTAALTAAIGLKQLRNIYLDPPPITAWKDVIGVIDMTRKALNMDPKANSGQPVKVGIDVSVLGFKPSSVKPSKPPIDVEVAEQQLED